jgi:hypothetical protein
MTLAPRVEEFQEADDVILDFKTWKPGVNVLKLFTGCG